MKSYVISGLLVILNSIQVGCGTKTEPSKTSLRQAVEATSQTLEGIGYNGKTCFLHSMRGDDGKLQQVQFKEDFKVEYKLPAPASGLYGVYYWPANFDTDVQLASGQWSVKRSLLRDADVLEGDGKALFWDGTRHHKLVFKPSIQAPKSVSYSSVEYLLGLIPFVVLDGLCTF